LKVRQKRARKVSFNGRKERVIRGGKQPAMMKKGGDKKRKSLFRSGTSVKKPSFHRKGESYLREKRHRKKT